VQDFTQAELLMDLRIVADPNGLFLCGDTAQTIARGIGFRFTGGGRGRLAAAASGWAAGCCWLLLGTASTAAAV
jgi:hypothetical protein